MGQPRGRTEAGAGPRPGRSALALVVWATASVASSYGQAPDRPNATPRAADAVAAEVEVSRGVIDFERGRYADALRRLDGADAAGAGVPYYRGLSLLALQRSKEALRDLEKVRRTPGAPDEAQLDAAVARLASGDPAGAEEVLNGYLAKKPADAYGHYFLGVARFRQKRYDEAIREFRLASADSALTPYLDFYQGLRSHDRGDPAFRDQALLPTEWVTNRV